MKANDIRKKFAEFFIKHGHDKIDSSPLIPQNDPTLLFANAGMNQFKDYFTGKANPSNRRAVTIQKCVRAGGKHNDLENVGFTARHHTFFEMLGNFSFGDYFKKEAIDFAWKFLTEELNIPKDKLYITCHDSDQEAADIWHNDQGIPRDRIFFMGDKDNFWEMGDTGPCGPCSEIFYDHGPENTDGSDTTECILDDEGRYVEIWNLVFMQYEKYKDGDEIKRRELPKPSVDTGAGLERIAAAMQGKYWNYDSDIFAPIFEAIENLSGKKYSDDKYTSSMRVIADHIRSSVMLITDGAIPGNEGRGYVLRSIIRRAVRHLSVLGLKDPSLHKLVDAVFVSLGEEYPENARNKDLPIKLLEIEEKKFRETLEQGLKLLDKELKNISGSTFPGEAAFKLFDTFGFPVDMTQTILKEQKMEVDMKAYDECMARQKAQSKKSGSFSAAETNIEAFYKIKEEFGATEFLGYNSTNAKSKLLALETVGDNTVAVFDKTPFYGESGGQAGDIGKVNGNINVLTTQKPVDDLIVHFLSTAEGLEVGKEYELAVDNTERSLTTRNHSATHLLQAALIKTLGNHVKQAGSLNTSDKLRFDFTHPEALTTSEIREVEKIVNQEIANSLSVDANIMNKDQAQEKGAMALFGEKYGDEVRVVEMGPFSVELCGGTHVQNTSEIGLFKILTEQSLSSGVRRIEAITSETANQYLADRDNALSEIEKLFSAKGDLLDQKLNNLLKDIKDKNKEIKALKQKLQEQSMGDIFSGGVDLGNGHTLTIAPVETSNIGELRGLSDKFIDKQPKGILLLYNTESDKLTYLLRTNKTNKDIKLNNILKDALPIINGRGGGRPDMVQGSGESANVEKFISTIQTGLQS